MIPKEMKPIPGNEDKSQSKVTSMSIAPVAETNSTGSLKQDLKRIRCIFAQFESDWNEYINMLNNKLYNKRALIRDINERLDPLDFELIQYARLYLPQASIDDAQELDAIWKRLNPIINASSATAIKTRNKSFSEFMSGVFKGDFSTKQEEVSVLSSLLLLASALCGIILTIRYFSNSAKQEAIQSLLVTYLRMRRKINWQRSLTHFYLHQYRMLILSVIVSIIIMVVGYTLPILNIFQYISSNMYNIWR